MLTIIKQNNPYLFLKHGIKYFIELFLQREIVTL